MALCEIELSPLQFSLLRGIATRATQADLPDVIEHADGTTVRLSVPQLQQLLRYLRPSRRAEAQELRRTLAEAAIDQLATERLSASSWDAWEWRVDRHAVHPGVALPGSLAKLAGDEVVWHETERWIIAQAAEPQPLLSIDAAWCKLPTAAQDLRVREEALPVTPRSVQLLDRLWQRLAQA